MNDEGATMPIATYDQALLAQTAARFDLRAPNRAALDALVRWLSEQPSVAGPGVPEAVADLATGVGKTYLMSSLVDYLAQQGVRNVLVVTPGSTLQRKTIANFTAAHAKYVPGAETPPEVITPENFETAAVAGLLRDESTLKVYVFNVQQLLPTTNERSRRTRADNEHLGGALYEHLRRCEDLVVIADEHHMYRERARAFSAAIRDLRPRALVGLTATPDPADVDKVRFQYTLGEAIADGHVKIPVIVYRQDGTDDERTQLRDACGLLRAKASSYAAYRQAVPGLPVNPVLFVVCKDIDHAQETAQTLAGPGFVGDPAAVLEVNSTSSDEALAALAAVEEPDSPIRAVVSVNMLKEGWDVKNIAVIVALRALASQTLTEQVLGRGLRLPFGARTGIDHVDTVDVVAHDSYEQLLRQKDVLAQRLMAPASTAGVDEHGTATGAGPRAEVAGPNAVGGPTADSQRPVPTQSEAVTAPSAPMSPTPLGSDGAPLLIEAGQRLDEGPPVARGRVKDAPTIRFPRRVLRVVARSFQLAEVGDAAARAAGASFAQEMPTFVSRDALDATRDGAGVIIHRRPLDSALAEQPLASVAVVRAELVSAVLQAPEVPQERASRGAAERLVDAFLAGAGVGRHEETAEWGQRRADHAVRGMRRLITEAIRGRTTTQEYDIEVVDVPVEPVLVPADALNAYNDDFARHRPYSAWQRHIMPTATFDAGTTEWRLAHLLDRDPAIRWWLRLSVRGPVVVPTPRDGPYYPDFIAIDADGGYWLVEGKSDRDARDDPSVARKKAAAEEWARHVRDNGAYGRWRYVFVTETDLDDTGDSWKALLAAVTPE